MYTIFVDFKKAFDLVPRKLLWIKLKNYGVPDRFIEMLMEMYRSVKACVKLAKNTITDEVISCDEGLKQGDSLSCYLFILYLNDLVDYLSENDASEIVICQLYITILMFADDLIMFDKRPRGLQRKINILSRYCEKWNLVVNVEKTKVVIFRKSVRKQFHDKWYYNGTEIEIVTEYKYLGLLLNCTGNWKNAKLDLARRGSKARLFQV